jgi:hypothetical protein
MILTRSASEIHWMDDKCATPGFKKWGCALWLLWWALLWPLFILCVGQFRGTQVL